MNNVKVKTEASDALYRMIKNSRYRFKTQFD